MSCKMSMKNGSINDPQWVKANNLIDTSVKLAGEEAKDRLYEPKHKKKLVRVLTVIAYVFFVSLAAIMLSLYYVFLWNGDQKILSKSAMQQRHDDQVKCDNILAAMQHQVQQSSSNAEDSYTSASPLATSTTTNDFNTQSYEFDSAERNSIFIKKLMSDTYPYAEND